MPQSARTREPLPDNVDVRVRVALGVAFLVVQAVVPVVIWFTQPRPAPFAWEMFAETPAPPHIQVVLEDGTRSTVNLSDVVVRTRGDIPYAQVLPSHLCRVIDGATAVVLDGTGIACDD